MQYRQAIALNHINLPKKKIPNSMRKNIFYNPE
jgi:hypothetical protein